MRNPVLAVQRRVPRKCLFVGGREQGWAVVVVVMLDW